MTWQLPKFQDLSRFKKIAFDTETTGLYPSEGARPIGLSVATEKDAWYYPWGHPGGPQYTKGEVLAWVRKEFQQKHIVGHHLKFDLLQMLWDGQDLRKCGNTFGDTMLAGPLLKERGRFGLDVMCGEYLGKEFHKVELPFPGSEICKHPSDEVGEYAEQDARLTFALDENIQAMIERHELRKVYQLECEVLPATVEMEYNGLHMDVEKLERWTDEVTRERNKAFVIRKGLNPNSGQEIAQYFDQQGWPYEWNWKCDGIFYDRPCATEWHAYEVSGIICPICGTNNVIKRNPHFGKDFLKRFREPMAQEILHARKLDKLLHTFLLPWQENIVDGVLYFQLNQLRRDDYGTVSGRFSANSLEIEGKRKGAQPQQIWNPKRQIEDFGDEYILRELFIPESGLCFSCDASQIEFRLVSHYSKAKKVLDAYREDPNTDFHNFVMTEIFKGRLSRPKAKDNNFTKIYGGGVKKLAQSIGCTYTEAKAMSDHYNREFPEIKDLMDKVSRVAKERGFIRTLYGRQRHFGADNAYVALNALIQGSAADVMKERLAALYQANLCTLRMTAHDEAMGDVESEQKGKQIKEVMEDFSIPLSVPLLWDLKLGKNWAMR